MYSASIPHDEVSNQGLSFTDPDGRLFKWNGNLFRGIPSERAPFCRNLFDEGIIKKLIAKKLLVETEIAPLKIDHYEIVLKHRTIPFVSYPQEWCDLMLKDAALYHLDFCLELNKYDLESADAHPLNILFDGCQPVFVDFGSIDPISENSTQQPWLAYEQFCRAFLRPLQLMAQGHERIARWLLHDYEQGVLKYDFNALIHSQISAKNLIKFSVNKLKTALLPFVPPQIGSLYKKLNSFEKRFGQNSSDCPPKSELFFKKLRREVETINLPFEQVIKSEENEYPFSPTSSEGCDINSQHLVSSILEDLQPSSVLHLGGDTYNILDTLQAARFSSQVVAVNPNESFIKRLYLKAKSANLPILPLRINFFSPSYDLSNYWFVPASERLQCDFILALDLVDHLVRENIRVDLIFERLSTISKRWLLMDFTPPEHWQKNDFQTVQHPWFTSDFVMDELKKWFRSVRIISSQPKPRLLLLCEK